MLPTILHRERAFSLPPIPHHQSVLGIGTLPADLEPAQQMHEAVHGREHGNAAAGAQPGRRYELGLAALGGG